jgi:ribosome biogenesis ATPase
LRVQSSKLRLEGDFDFVALAKATPGYVGADLASLTGAAGIIAVKRIFQQISEGTLILPELVSESSTLEGDSSSMLVDSPVPPPDVDAIPQTSSKPTPFSGFNVSNSSASSIVHFLRAHPDPLTEAQLSPLNIRYADFEHALSHVQPSSKREGFATIPDVTWSDIGALHETREELQMAIVQPIRRPELFKAVGIDMACGVLMWGPPGCGKTLLAKAVANESKANFISVKGPELLNKVCARARKNSSMIN